MDKKLETAWNNHRELWFEVASLCRTAAEEEKFEYSNADDVKAAAIQNLGYEEDELNFDCFCCDYTGYCSEDAYAGDFSKCKYCPVDWGIKWSKDIKDPPCCAGLFDDFDTEIHNEDYWHAYYLALEIADLPLNPIYLEEE